jgi:hypothetical protein
VDYELIIHSSTIRINKSIHGATCKDINNIDYIVTNRNVHPTQIIDIRSQTSTDVGSDHSLVLCKMRMKIRRNKLPSPLYETKINVQSLHDKTIRDLHMRRLSEKIEQNKIVGESNIESGWTKLKNNIIAAEMEAVGERKINKNQTIGVRKTP